ncbi:hypothetical protein [Marinicella sp. W31]|uniref:hypothetical protein n=1 Tax=Marinicella sp. W31 TaxID=3023713 RepID=UPI0037574873
MQKLLTTLLILLMSLSVVTISNAEVLLIERVEQSQATDRPKRASTMNQVRNQFGEPSRVVSAIGEPPITQWVYSNFTVYFENQYVINTVMHQANADEKGPKPLN